GGDPDFLEGSWIESNGLRMQHSFNSSSNSNSSSISSISSGSSDSDYKMTTSELEADADSLSCRQSGLSSNDQMENDGLKLVLLFIHIHSIDFYNH
ncbi:hypothetical protein OIU85_028791, partial [Salix viminalis]